MVSYYNLVGQIKIQFHVSSQRNTMKELVGYNIKQIVFDTQEKPLFELFYSIRENEDVKLYAKDRSFEPNLLPEYVEEVLDKQQLKFMQLQDGGYFSTGND